MHSWNILIFANINRKLFIEWCKRVSSFFGIQCSMVNGGSTNWSNVSMHFMHNTQSNLTLEIQIFKQFKLNMKMVHSLHDVITDFWRKHVLHREFDGKFISFFFSWKPLIQCLSSLNGPNKVSFKKVHWWNRLSNNDWDTSFEWKTQEFTLLRWYKCLMSV